MRVQKFIAVFTSLLLLATVAGAQTIPVQKANEKNYSGRAKKAEIEKMIGTRIDTKTLPIEHNRYKDERLKELEKNMQERDWGTESTAWEAARKANTKESYQRYLAMYPYAAHSADANRRLIDLRVNDVLNSNHDQLPGMTRVYADDESPTSTIIIENGTNMPLTVMYSGAESKSIIIPEGSRMALTIKNGYYRIAASVPAANIHPFAGSENLAGGQYEVTYIIVPKRQ